MTNDKTTLRPLCDTRLYIWRLFILTTILCLTGGLAFFQVVNSDRYVELSLSNRLRMIRIPPVRGQIFDRNGVPLALNVMSFDIMGYPQDLRGAALKEQFLKVLERHGIPIGKEQLEQRIKSLFWTPFRAIPLISNLPKAQMIAIVGDPEFPHRLFPIPVWRRTYPAGPLTAHVVGYVGEISEKELKTPLEEDEGSYVGGDAVGKAGIEKSYEQILRGQSGETTIEVDARGRPRGKLQGKAPTAGKDIHLTLDLGVQKYAADLLGERSGAAVALDVRNGEVLALWSYPTYDPNPLAWGVSRTEWSALTTDPERPMMNRAISGQYSPGSTFKVVSGYAALESGKMGGGTTFFCPGKFEIGTQTFRCWRHSGHGSENIVTALRDSCDVFFYESSQLAGIESYIDLGHRLGLGTQTGIDLPGEAAGNLAGPEWTESTGRGAWRRGDTVNYSIGQGYLLMTPIQIANVFAVFADGGILRTPHLNKDQIFPEQDLHLKPEYVRLIRQGLEAVTKKGGTGHYAGEFGVHVAGKSGTVQYGNGKDHAVFAGFAPAENPRYAVVFFVEDGESGGRVAGPLVGQLLAYLVKQERKAGSQ